MKKKIAGALVGARVGALVTALSGALLPGCSSRDPALTKPAELAPIKSPIAVQTVWRVGVGKSDRMPLQPAVVENAVYAASAGGVVVRIAPDTGGEIWRVELNAKISAGVGSDGLLLAVATPRGEVIALAPDGKEVWRARVSSDVTAPPLVGRGLVIVRSTDHRLAAFEADSGKRRWVFSRQQPPLTLRAPTEMAFAGDNVLVGFPGGKLVAIALANGAARWESTVSEPKGTTEVERLSDVVGPVAVSERDVCAASFQGRIMCADQSNGNLRWSREVSALAGPSIGAQQVFAVDARAHVIAYGRDSGGVAWRNETLRNRALTTPLATPRAVVIGDLEGYLHYIAPDDGAVIGRARVDSSAIVSRPQRWADGVVVQTQDGAVALVTAGR